MLVFSVETSCDETSVCIMKDDKTILSHIQSLEFGVGKDDDWLKIRTDQFINLEYVSGLKIVKNRLYVPKMYPRGFHDFYFIANYDFLKKISYDYVFKHKEIEENLHKDFPLNIGYNKSIFYRVLLKLREFSKNKENKYFKYFSILTSLYIRHKIDQLFIELPKEMRKGIMWRGEDLKSF